MEEKMLGQKTFFWRTIFSLAYAYTVVILITVVGYNSIRLMFTHEPLLNIFQFGVPVTLAVIGTLIAWVASIIRIFQLEYQKQQSNESTKTDDIDDWWNRPLN